MSWPLFSIRRQSGQERNSLLDPELTRHVISSLELAVVVMTELKPSMPGLNYRVTQANLDDSIPSQTSGRTLAEGNGMVSYTRKEMLTHLAPALTIYADQYQPFFDAENRSEGILGRLPLNALPTCSSTFLGELGPRMRDQIYILNYTNPLTVAKDRDLSDDARVLKNIVPAAAGLLLDLHGCFDYSVNFQSQCQYLHTCANDLDGARVDLDLGLNQSLTRKDRQKVSSVLADIRDDRFVHFVREMAGQAAKASTVLVK
jgi:hypothetical protein